MIKFYKTKVLEVMMIFITIEISKEETGNFWNGLVL